MLKTMKLALAAGAATLATAAIAQTTPAPAETTAPPAQAQTTPAPAMTATQGAPTIAAAVGSEATLTTLEKAVETAGLEATLAGPGPYTVFAPTNDAFTRLAPGALDALMQPANKPVLEAILKYHVVPGELTADQLKARIAAGNGTAMLQTVAGQTITATIVNDSVKLTDALGNVGYVTEADKDASNGVVHLVNGVLLPKT